MKISILRAQFIFKLFHSKICLNCSQKLFTDTIWGQLENLVGGFSGPKNRENSQNYLFLDLLKTSLIDSFDPKLCLWIVFDYNSSIFYYETI